MYTCHAVFLNGVNRSAPREETEKLQIRRLRTKQKSYGSTEQGRGMLSVGVAATAVVVAGVGKVVG